MSTKDPSHFRGLSKNFHPTRREIESSTIPRDVRYSPGGSCAAAPRKKNLHAYYRVPCCSTNVLFVRPLPHPTITRAHVPNYVRYQLLTFYRQYCTAMEIEMLARDEKSRPARCRGAKRSSTIYGGAVPVGQVSLARRIGDPELLYGRSFSDTFQNRIDASRVMPVFSARATKCAANRASPTICRATVSSQSAACKAEAPVKSARGKTSIAIRIRVISMVQVLCKCCGSKNRI